VIVVEAPVEATYDLRKRVLRDDTPSDDVTFAQDAWPATFHLVAKDDDGRLVGTATFFPSPTPWREGRAAVQLRGMAVDSSRQGAGVGRKLVEAGMERARAIGAEAMWANARDSALPFYRRLGFEVVGRGFMTRDTQLPHHVIVRDL
jgi:predicted N-acetyltransferase YhbS